MAVLFKFFFVKHWFHPGFNIYIKGVKSQTAKKAKITVMEKVKHKKTARISKEGLVNLLIRI